jgi:membrane protease YdiL (CAAX protease family)
MPGSFAKGVSMETAVPATPETDAYRPIAAPLHTIFVLAAVAVWAGTAVLGVDQLRAAVNPNRLQLYSRTILYEWMMFAIVILGVRLHGSPLRAVLGERWGSFREILRDFGIAAPFWIVSTLLISVFGGHHQGSGTDRAVQFLLPHGGIETILWTVTSVSAGICEESLYRGYLQQQFKAVTKNVPLGILLSAVAFAAAHAYQGLRGAILIGIGASLSGILAHWRKSVRPGMIAHAWNDFFAGVLASLLKIRVG